MREEQNYIVTTERQQKMVFPAVLNDRGILFGGYALQWMDEMAYLTATKFTLQNVVTVSVDKVSFLLPVTEGSMIEIIGRVTTAGQVKIKVKVEIWAAGKFSHTSHKAVEGWFTFSPVDEMGKPVRRSLDHPMHREKFESNLW